MRPASTQSRELGDKFDVRQFHDQVLGNGALPLDVLEQRLKDPSRSATLRFFIQVGTSTPLGATRTATFPHRYRLPTVLATRRYASCCKKSWS
jgi:hypothetical protein